MPSVQHMRGTRAALDALAAGSGLLAGQVYVITDEARIGVALSASTYETFARQDEITPMVVLTQAAYDALDPPDPDTTYYISG